MIKSQYEKLLDDRTAYEDRAELYSQVTLPFIFPSDTTDGSTAMEDNLVQSLGGMGVNSLASKLVLSLLPPQGRFFRLQPSSAEALNDLTGGDEDAKAEIISILSEGEEQVISEIERQDIRTSFYTIMRALIIVGNILVEKKENSGVKLHTLRNYVVDRDSRQKPVDIILKETIHKDNIPDVIADYTNESEKDEFDLYTRFKLEDGKWIRTQEIENEPVGQEATYDMDNCPVKALGWNFLPDANYARSYVEDIVGDLIQYEKCTKLFVDGSMGNAKQIWTVNPMGQTRKNDVTGAENLDVIDGRAEDVTVIRSDKTYDMSLLAQYRDELRRSIGKAFLDTGSVQRDAERVTAQEVQMMVRELETGLAGTFSLLANDLLLTIVKWIIDEIGIETGSDTDIKITVGVDALSRNKQADTLMQYINAIHTLRYNDYLSEAEIVQRLANYMGINSVNLIHTPNEVKKKRSQAAQAAQAQQAGMSMAQQAGQQQQQI